MEWTPELRKSVHPESFFKLNGGSIFKRLFEGVEFVWEGLDRLFVITEEYFLQKNQQDDLPAEFEYKEWINREGWHEKMLFVKSAFQADKDLFIPQYDLAIGKDTVFEPTVLIKPPLIVGRCTEIRQGAYIRGGVMIGAHCTIGHATEVKTAVFMDHTEAGHFAYVGDSILGRCVNLGAGTKLANLPFRTLEQKEKVIFEPFDLKIGGHKYYTGKSKLGAILADGVETGCNSTLAPGTLVGSDSWIFPCIFVKGGYYPPRSLLKSDSKIKCLHRR
ncbi:glucose-1-phosphate thymidylyltransferase [bacterium]|nr:glucose-1-phosphate thymidylyltransferase [bacterium]